MTTSAKLSLKGLEEYLERLAQSAANVDESAGRALAAGGDVVLEGMDADVPRDTGDLADHLHRTEPKTVGNYTFVEVGVFDGEHLPSAELARKAVAQEYGYTRGGKHYPGRSYIRKPLEERKRAALAAMKASLQKDGKA